MFFEDIRFCVVFSFGCVTLIKFSTWLHPKINLKRKKKEGETGAVEGERGAVREQLYTSQDVIGPYDKIGDGSNTVPVTGNRSPKREVHVLSPVRFENGKILPPLKETQTAPASKAVSSFDVYEGVANDRKASNAKAPKND